MSGHTPGPWKWSSGYETIDGRPTWSLVGETDGYGILSCDGEENSPQGMNDEANARLIAAAPTMYDYIRKCAEAGDSEAMNLLESIHASR